MHDIFVAPKNNELQKPKLSFQSNDEHGMNDFSSFSQNPKGVHFQTQKEDELVILFLRSHIITNLPWIITSVILLTLPIFSIFLLPNLNVDLLSSPEAGRFIAVFVLFYLLIVFSYMFVSFLSWFYNVFIVSTRRMVDIDYSDIVVHNISTADLNHVVDVHYTQSGFIPTFFNYGHIFAQTAGNEKNFEAYSVPLPRKATNIIIELIGKGKK